MGFFDDLASAAEGAYGVAQSVTREYVRYTIQDRLTNAAMLAIAQIGSMLALLALGWYTDWALWTRLLISGTFMLMAAFNTLRFFFKSIPELFGFLGGWRRTWLDLMGINLFGILLVENSGLLLFWGALIASRSLLNWNVEILSPWIDLYDHVIASISSV